MAESFVGRRRSNLSVCARPATPEEVGRGSASEGESRIGEGCLLQRALWRRLQVTAGDACDCVSKRSRNPLERIVVFVISFLICFR